MSNIMKTRCPKCNVYGQHPVIETDPTAYRWSDKSQERLNDAFGHGLSHRRHTRKCVNCGFDITSCEISYRDLSDVMELWERDELQLKGAKTKLRLAENHNQRLLSHFNTLLKRRGSGHITSLTQDVGMLWMELGADTIKTLKTHGITTFSDILILKKSELMKQGDLTESQWQKLAKLFADSGLTLEDDTPSVAA